MIASWPLIGSTGFDFLAIYDASMDDISTKLADLYEMGLESLPSRITIRLGTTICSRWDRRSVATFGGPSF